MQVLFVTSEAHPLAKSGGLADVSGALPAALRCLGVDARILMPGYPSALVGLKKAKVEMRLEPLLGIDDGVLLSGQLPGSEVPVWLIYAPSLYSRGGGLYQDKNGQDWPDNAIRFAFLAHVAAKIGDGLLDWVPDLVHANDWHAGLLPLLFALRASPAPASLFTIHNLAHQGNFPAETLSRLGIPERLFHIDGLEFYGQVSFMKAAIRFADKISTVSPTYAREVMTTEFGCGLEGVLQQRHEDFSGILNGIDDAIWNPATDNHLAHAYSARDITGKRHCKLALQRELGLTIDCDRPIIGYASRLVHQKMADVLAHAIPAIAGSGAQFVLVGEGDPEIESALSALQARSDGNVAIHIGHEEALAHRLHAGADIMMAPARYEPCGLTQLYALRYGTVPIVRRTGGLADTVRDATAAALTDRSATGFVFDEPNVHGILRAAARALAAYREPLTWRRLQLGGMAQDFSWRASAEQYVALYRETTGLVTSADLLPAEETERQVAL